MKEPEKASPRKRNRLAIALAILCVFLLAVTIIVAFYYTSIDNLQFSTDWADHTTIVPGAGGYLEIHETANHAGYVTVNIQSSTTNNTYVQVAWSSNGINYNNNFSIGTDGKIVFLVLPSSVDIRIGTTNNVNGATAMLTVTYTY